MRRLAALIAVIAGCLAAPAIAQQLPPLVGYPCRNVLLNGMMAAHPANLPIIDAAPDQNDLIRRNPFGCGNGTGAFGARRFCRGITWLSDHPAQVLSRGSGYLVIRTELDFTDGVSIIIAYVKPETAACRSGPPAD